VRCFPSFRIAIAATGLVATGALEAQERVSFHANVRPILEQRCQVCHNAEARQGGLSLADYEGILKGGQNGPAVIPGKPRESKLTQQVSGSPPKMPMAGEPLTAEQVALVRLWIAQGAADDTPADNDTRWWSFRRLGRPVVPTPPGLADWPKTPIDQFILATLAEKGLAPSDEADRRTLIRRLSFDLHGLPPSPEQIDRFVSDRSGDAYEGLVDRLLASPRYGERWGRHWLDVVHYGESHGFDKDKARRNAWPYRDYVIRAFNNDKPYVRFVEEQLAGDVLDPDSPEGVIATGFIAAGPWDYVGHAELRDGTHDKRVTRNLDRDDMVMSAMSTFASLTVHCARCHDHKFDPIRQDDYYSLQAVFAGVDRADRPFDRDPTVFRKRLKLRAERRGIEHRLQPLLAETEKITSPRVKEIAKETESLDQLSTDLLPKVGEVETDETKTRREELGKQIKALGEERKSLQLGSLDSDDRQRLEALEAQLEDVDKRIATLPEPEEVYAAAAYFERHGRFSSPWDPRPIYVLHRGDVESPGEPAGAGAISAVDWLPARFPLDDPDREGTRRLALAKWITDPENPLTWRSIVNRVWHYHFGAGLVDSPNDFGKMGSRPTHPELLDWLAAEFRDNGGSFKKLHKLIVVSAVYRQSSNSDSERSKIDAQNQFLWRMNRRRLDAESVRDAALLVSGKLDLTMGGPSAEHFFFKDDHSPIYDYARFDVDAPESYRRAVYRFIVRSVPDPFMESLDCPDPSLLTPKRSSTLTAIQALAMLNDPFVLRQAEHLSKRLRETRSELTEQITEAYRLALGRKPTPEESQILTSYGEEHGLENVCRLILNSSEFMFVD
jgi:mono/diheme cytochrome c family protein